MAETSMEGAAFRSSKLYRTIWRWHFYAGLLVIPFAILLAITGGIYLFKDEIDSVVSAKRLYVAEAQATPLPASEIIKRANAAVAGTPVKYTPAPAAERSAEVAIKTEQGNVSVYVNPYDGAVLGSVHEEWKLMNIVRRLHSLAWFGKVANHLIEIAAGWMIVLIVTGIYLWWPRGDGGVASVRGSPKRRVFWRDLHAVTGAFAGFIVLFLAISGMPWSAFWGAQLNKQMTAHGMGYPPELWDNVPGSTVPLKHHGEVGWTVENSPVPKSEPDKGTPIGIDKAVAIAEGAGIAKGYTMEIPATPEGVFTASVFPENLAEQRLVHIDQYSGKPLVDLEFAEFGTGAKIVEWGISVHQGQEWGLFNQLLMLAGCIALITASITGITMWWKRRPVGKIAAPQTEGEGRIGVIAFAIAALIGVLYPLVGGTMLAALVVDAALPKGFKEKWVA